MTPEQEAALQYHSREIAKLLYDNSEPEDVQTLEGIETTVRSQMLEHVSPQVGFFYRNHYRDYFRPYSDSQKYSRHLAHS